MGDGVPHQGPTLEGHVAGQQPTDAANNSTDEESPEHPGLTEGFQQPGHQQHGEAGVNADS